MGWFRNNKPSEIDTGQDKQIEQIWAWINQLNKNQQILIKNNNAFVQQIADLQKRVADGEKLDAQQQAALDGLVQTAISIQQATKEKTET
jgi:hypothetical protein